MAVNKPLSPASLAAQFLAAFTTQSRHTPTPDQHRALEALAHFLAEDDNGRPVFVLKGYAGTGKTTLVSTLTKTVGRFGLRPYLMAPTGRAAKVMATYSGRAAFTIHRTIYRKPEKGLLFTTLARNNHTKTLFIVDEASMIACQGRDNLLAPLLAYVFSNEDNKLLLVGDDAQLPPVSQPESLALNMLWMQQHSGAELAGAQLRQVIRQAAESGILANATALRNKLGQGTPQVALHTRGYPDVFAMTGERIQEGIEYAYAKYGHDQTLVITNSNKRAAQYNQMLRINVLHRENELDSQDLVMIVKNNYAYAEQAGAAGFLANGDFARIVRVRRFEEMHGLHFADVEMELPDYPTQPPFSAKVLLDTLHSDKANLPADAQEALYQAVVADYPEANTPKLRADALKQDPFFNALQIKFAYVLTCHKAQGGQWQAVFVDQGYLPDGVVTLEWQRWLYTAITRARSELFLINFEERFYNEPAFREGLTHIS